MGDGGLLKTVTSPRFSSSKDGNGDSNSQAQATQGTRERWGILAKAGQRDSGQSELLSGKSSVAGAVS